MHLGRRWWMAVDAPGETVVLTTCMRPRWSSGFLVSACRWEQARRGRPLFCVTLPLFSDLPHDAQLRLQLHTASSNTPWPWRKQWRIFGPHRSRTCFSYVFGWSPNPEAWLPPIPRVLGGQEAPMRTTVRGWPSPPVWPRKGASCSPAFSHTGLLTP